MGSLPSSDLSMVRSAALWISKIDCACCSVCSFRWGVVNRELVVDDSSAVREIVEEVDVVAVKSGVVAKSKRAKDVAVTDRYRQR